MSSANLGRLLILVAVPLAGCGGEGDGSGVGPIQATFPPPVVTPPSPASTDIPAPTGIFYPRAPSGIITPTEFALLDSLFSSATGTRIPASALVLRWLGQPATYSLKVAAIGEGELRQNSSADPALQLIGSSGQSLMTGIDIPQAKGRYTGLLARYRDPSFSAAFGLPTMSSAIPTAGVRAYRAVPQGYNIKLDVDFVTRQITGSIDLAWEDAWGPYPPVTYPITPTSFAPAETEFSISFAVPGAPEQGRIVGRFTGPGAEELMVSWRGQVKNIYDGSWQTQGGVTVLTSTF